MNKVDNQVNNIAELLQKIPPIFTGKEKDSVQMKNVAHLKRAVEYYSENKHQDIVKEIQNGTYKQTEEIPDREFKKHEKELNKNTSVTLPIIK